MNYIEFGMEKRKLSQIILGLMRIDRMTNEELENYLDAAYENGINVIDIADCYNNGGCEAKLGEVLNKRNDFRSKFFLQSKCGIRVDSDFTWFDFSKEYILEAVDASLMRLKTDSLDSLLLHRPDALMEPEEIAEAFSILHKCGKVRNFGVSNFNPMMLQMLTKYIDFPICTNQIQLSCAHTPGIDASFNVNMYNDKSIMHDGGILEYCHMNDIPVQAWSSLQYGYFEGVFLGSDKYLKLNEVLDRIAKEKNVTSTSVALAWILRYPAKMQAVIGTTKISRMIESAKACDIVLTRKEWYEIYLAAGNKLP